MEQRIGRKIPLVKFLGLCFVENSRHFLGWHIRYETTRNNFKINIRRRLVLSVSETRVEKRRKGEEGNLLSEYFPASLFPWYKSSAVKEEEDEEKNPTEEEDLSNPCGFRMKMNNFIFFSLFSLSFRQTGASR